MGHFPILSVSLLNRPFPYLPPLASRSPNPLPPRRWPAPTSCPVPRIHQTEEFELPTNLFAAGKDLLTSTQSPTHQPHPFTYFTHRQPDRGRWCWAWTSTSADGARVLNQRLEEAIGCARHPLHHFLPRHGRNSCRVVEQNSSIHHAHLTGLRSNVVIIILKLEHTTQDLICPYMHCYIWRRERRLIEGQMTRRSQHILGFWCLDTTVRCYHLLSNSERTRASIESSVQKNYKYGGNYTCSKATVRKRMDSTGKTNMNGLNWKDKHEWTQLERQTSIKFPECQHHNGDFNVPMTAQRRGTPVMGAG